MKGGGVSEITGLIGAEAARAQTLCRAAFLPPGGAGRLPSSRKAQRRYRWSSRQFCNVGLPWFLPFGPLLISWRDDRSERDNVTPKPVPRDAPGTNRTGASPRTGSRIRVLRLLGRPGFVSSEGFLSLDKYIFI